MKTWPFFLEITNPTATKARALQILGEHLGFEARDVLAFGDSYNDADMLLWAGTGVAMAGAPPEVVAASDDTCGPVEEDGVARYLHGAALVPGRRLTPAAEAQGRAARPALDAAALREAQQRRDPAHLVQRRDVLGHFHRLLCRMAKRTSSPTASAIGTGAPPHTRALLHSDETGPVAVRASSTPAAGSSGPPPSSGSEPRSRPSRTSSNPAAPRPFAPRPSLMRPTSCTSSRCRASLAATRAFTSIWLTLMAASKGISATTLGATGGG